MAAIPGLRGTGDWSVDERPKNFRDGILFLNPNGSTPIFGLMGRAGSKKVNDPEFSWWNETNSLGRFQINGGAVGAGTTPLPIDSTDPDGTDMSRNWGLARHLKAGDLLLVESTNEIVRVSATPTADNAIPVTRGYAGSTAAAIGDNAFLLHIGSSYAEGSDAPDATTRNPQKFFNLCQIFKTAYEETNTAIVTDARTGPVLANDKKRKMFDHSRAIELAMLFGIRSEIVGSNGKPERTMAGLRQLIPTSNQTAFGGTTTWTQWVDATYRVFDWDSPSGNTRVLFCGNLYLNVLNNIARISGQVRFADTVEVFGMRLQRMILPQGEILLKTHPLLNRSDFTSRMGFILDFAALKWVYLRDTKHEDQIQTIGRDSLKGQWLTEGSLMVDYAGLTMAVHSNLTAAA